jgi:uncharacterized membrane protein
LAFLLLIVAVIALIMAIRAGDRARALEREMEQMRAWGQSVDSRLRRLQGQAPATPSSEEAAPVTPPPAPPDIVLPPRRPAAAPPTPPPAAPPPEPRVPSARASADAVPPVFSAPAARATTRPAAAPPAGGRGIEGLEERIGQLWLNRIGIALLVIGITFGLGYTLANLGPAGKAGLATAVSLLLVGSGVLLEKRQDYGFYGRGLIAGGWAALYATAYAVHELEATRIVHDPRLGFLLLLLVGSGMIVHSLRYRNQGLTATAYGLAYAAIVLHAIRPYTLVAATILGLGTVLHLLRRRWYQLGFGGIAATYGSLLLWHVRRADRSLETLRLGLGALTVDWLVFLAADFAPEPEDAETKRNAGAVSLLNGLAAGWIAYLMWTRASEPDPWRPLMAFGTAYVLTSAGLRYFGRITAHRMHVLLATLLVAVAARNGLPSTGESWVWLAEAQALILIGVVLKDRFHRVLGGTFFLLPLVAIVRDQVMARIRRPDAVFDPQHLLVTSVAAGCFYLSFACLKPFASSAGPGRIEEGFRRAFSYAAFFLISLSLWVQVREVHLAAAAAALMLVLFEASLPHRVLDLRVQSHLAAVYAMLAALFLTAGSRAALAAGASWLPEGVSSMHARVPVLVAVGAAYLAVFLRQRHGRARVLEEDAALRPLLPWAGAGLVALLIWLEARPTVIGPAWMILGLLLVEAGIALGERDLRRPGYLAVLGAHLSLLLSNLTATGLVSGWSVRTLTLVPSIGAACYLWWRLREVAAPRGREAPAPPGAKGIEAGPLDESFGRLLAYLAGGLLGLYVRFEFGLNGAAPRWSLAMLALLALGYVLRDADLRLMGYVLGGMVFVRAVGFDFRRASPIFGLDGPLVVAVVGVMAYMAAGLLIRARAKAPGRPTDRRSLALESRLEARGSDLMWLMAVALAALYFYGTRSGWMLIVAWAIEGLAAAVLGFVLQARSMRLGGLALLGIGVARAVLLAFIVFDTAGRIISFIVLGVVLLVVSLGYTRYRERLRKTP